MSPVRVSCLAKEHNSLNEPQRVNLDRPILPLGHLVVAILKRLKTSPDQPQGTG